MDIRINDAKDGNVESMAAIADGRTVVFKLRNSIGVNDVSNLEDKIKDFFETFKGLSIRQDKIEKEDRVYLRERIVINKAAQKKKSSHSIDRTDRIAIQQQKQVKSLAVNRKKVPTISVIADTQRGTKERKKTEAALNQLARANNQIRKRNLPGRVTSMIEDTPIAMPVEPAEAANNVLELTPSMKARLPSEATMKNRCLRQSHVDKVLGSVTRNWQSKSAIKRRSGVNNEYNSMALAYLTENKQVEMRQNEIGQYMVRKM